MIQYRAYTQNKQTNKHCMGEINTNMFKEKCVNLIEVLKSALVIISGLYTVKTCIITELEVPLEIQMVKNLFLTL
jgi:hypothetical protein